MKSVIFWTIALTILFFYTSHHARADDYSVRFGPGIANSKLTGATKAFGFRREAEMDWGLNNAFELGGYTDSRANHSAAGLFKTQLGVKPGMQEGIYGKAFTGPCLISTTDSALGGHFQFCEDIGIGLRDTKTFMGIAYQHISSAGIESPNLGRDNILFEAGVRF